MTFALLTCARLFHLFVAKFSVFGFLQTVTEAPKITPAVLDSGIHLYTEEDDLDQCLYYLQTLSNILRWSSDSMWAALEENTISTDRSHQSLYRISE